MRQKENGMLLRVLLLLGLSTLAWIAPALAEWSVVGDGYLYYTDDVALFSAVRRSTMDGDPTQPVLDVSRTGVGSDMVFEPGALISNAITTGLSWNNRNLRDVRSHFWKFPLPFFMSFVLQPMLTLRRWCDFR